MSWIAVSDPLAMLALQTVVGTPATEGAAVGTTQLDRPQVAAVIGEPVPVVFARRRKRVSDVTVIPGEGDVPVIPEEGGVLVSPRATEARFENSASNEITAYYHLVLSEGQIGSIERRDLYQGQCRVGAYAQTYDRRAGTWDPGNFIVDSNTPYQRFFRLYTPFPGPTPTQEEIERYNIYQTIRTLTSPSQLDEYPFEIFTWYPARLIDPTAITNQFSWAYEINGEAQTIADFRDVPATNYKLPTVPNYCGTVGTYPDISTMSYQITVPDGSDYWKQQVHCFIREGMRVQRLFDNTFGPSDNICDLMQWALLRTGKVPATLIDTPALTASAAFTERYGLRCNGEFHDSTNVPDLIAQWARYFLLRETNANGKKGLRPALPVKANGELITDAITPAYTFTDDVIMPGSLEISYSPLADRLPFVAQIMWRQHPDGHDVDTVRTAEVRFAGQALDGPYESHDLSQVCTSELHAVRVGAYLVSKRMRCHHTARLTARPQVHNQLLNQGDVVRVRIRREIPNNPVSFHDWLYQIERISKTLAGDVSYELVHFPVDAQGRSLVTEDVLAVQPTGIILPDNRTGPNCDLYGDDDRTLPTDDGRVGDGFPSTDIPGFPGGGTGGTGTPSVPKDTLDEPPTPLGVFPSGPVLPGTAVFMPENPCGEGNPPPVWRWLQGNEQWSGQNKRFFVIGTAEIQVGSGPPLRGEYRCPTDPDWNPQILDRPIDNLPPGREVQLYWGVSIRRYGFIGPVGGWYPSDWYLYVVTLSEFIDYQGNPSTQDEIWLAKPNGVNEKLTIGNNASIWVVKSRYRDNGGPWQNLYDYSQFL